MQFKDHADEYVYDERHDGYVSYVNVHKNIISIFLYGIVI